MDHEYPSPFLLRREQGCLIVTARGPEIEIETKEVLYAEADAGMLEPRQVVLNLQYVNNFKSEILGVLIQFQRKVEKAGGRLKAVCPDPHVVLLFQITKLDLILDLYKSERLAIEAFTDSPTCLATA